MPFGALEQVQQDAAALAVVSETVGLVNQDRSGVAEHLLKAAVACDVGLLEAASAQDVGVMQTESFAGAVPHSPQDWRDR